jgi:hypothetical protein
MIDPAALQRELELDPSGRGYPPMPGPQATTDDQVAYDTLCEALLIDPTGALVQAATLTGLQILGCLVATEYVGVPAERRQMLDLIVTRPGAIPISGNILASLQYVLEAAPASVANLGMALFTRGSRAAQLGLDGVAVSDISNARRHAK